MDERDPPDATDTPAANHERAVDPVSLPRNRRLLRLTWILTLCMSIAIWLTIARFADKTTRIDLDGVMHEPLFGLVPIGFLIFSRIRRNRVDRCDMRYFHNYQRRF